MPKKKKYPKKPKMNSNMSVWKRYKDKCAAVKKHNDAIEKEQEDKRKIQENVMKGKSS